MASDECDRSCKDTASSRDGKSKVGEFRTSAWYRLEPLLTYLRSARTRTAPASIPRRVECLGDCQVWGKRGLGLRSSDQNSNSEWSIDRLYSAEQLCTNISGNTSEQ